MIQNINLASNQFTDWCELRLSNKYWPLIIVLSTLIISLFFSFPSYQSFEQILKENRPVEVTQQISNLPSYWQTNNGRNTVFRITVPIIAGLVGLDIKGAYGLQFLSGILLFYFVARIAERESKSRVIALFITLSVGGIYAGITSFWEFRATYDGIALLFLVIALWSDSPWIIMPSILLASFTDERAILASSFVFLWWFIREFYKNNSLIKALFNKQTISLIMALAIGLIIRVGITEIYHVTTYVQANKEFLLFNQINMIPMGLWTALEAGWIIVLFAILVLIRKRQYIILGLFTLFILIQSIVALSIIDITRSMAYLLPAYILAYRFIIPELKNDLRLTALYIAALNLFFVNYVASGKSSIWWIYPFPIQLVRWIFNL
jgi:hypothetical protein